MSKTKPTTSKIVFAIDCDFYGRHLVSIENGVCNPSWIKVKHLDRRSGYLTIFDYDPFTGKKIDLRSIKNMLTKHE